ncbi:MAG TPA: hypothetical protein VK795_00490 [Terriglobales bacterium]|jgi:hypothetical protein|nr:hypothetical protein [Terriglobales bacterium]
MEKHIMRLSYSLCLLCAVLAVIARVLAALNLPSALFTGVSGNPGAIGYHSFMDGVILFFMTTVATAGFAWVKKNAS